MYECFNFKILNSQIRSQYVFRFADESSNYDFKCRKNSLLLKINYKVIASITVSNFKELWVAIRDNGKILTCWCCNHVISCHTLTAPALMLLVPGIKAQKKNIKPKQISDMVMRKCKILMIRMLRLENRQVSVHCKFCS